MSKMKKDGTGEKQSGGKRPNAGRKTKTDKKIHVVTNHYLEPKDLITLGGKNGVKTLVKNSVKSAIIVRKMKKDK